MSKLWSLFVVLPGVLLSTAFFGVVSAAIALLGRKTEKRQIAVARAWARSLLWIGGVKLEVEGRERLHAQGPYVFSANHLSFFDTPVALAAIPVQFRFLAKEELFRFPWLFIGWHLKTAGHVPVPLDDPRASVRALSRTAKLIESDGTSVFFFSEGGRSEDGTLQEFKDGAAYIAIKAGAPLVPVALIGVREILPKGSSLVRGGRVRVRIGEPMSSQGLTLKARGALTVRSREALVELLGGKADLAANPRE
jgi:1-acyl-sn-glycerol-3-phosphate acyltransferase